MPVAGSMIAKNERLKNEPMLINSDPFGESWIIKINISDLAEIDNLLDASGYQQLTGV
jgi:glycine cleavage system H protein